MLRCFDVENAAKAVVLDHGLRSRSKMVQISKCHSIDAGRVPVPPPTPDEARDVEEKRGVVGQRLTRYWLSVEGER